MTALFVDTSAFVALADRRDGHHAGAKRLLRRLTTQRRPLVTSTDVFDELVTFVRMRLGHAVAVQIGERLLQTRWCRLVDIDDAIRLAAWQIFARYHDQLFSLTDCTSFALMRAMRLGEAFTFDRKDFAAAGFIPLP